MASKPAPGDLETIRGFVNTRDIDHDEEALSSPAALVGWLAENGLIDPTTRATEAQLRDAVAVREALRSLLEEHNGAEPDPDAFPTLDRAAEAARFTIHFEDCHDAHSEPRAKGVPGAIGRLLSIVHEAMADGTWDRLKACAADDCRWAFYDHAKNHSGRWCEMAVCGNREKARSYRARHA